MFNVEPLKESFVGFTIDGVHSSSLGIIRTIDSMMPLSTTGFQDVINPKIGADGEIWYNTTYTKKDIPINFAFDGITEAQLAQIKSLFNSKKLITLILDEEPYKVWMVKPSQSATMSQLCFDINGQRLYRGEGSVTFTSQLPYAKCPFLYKEEYCGVLFDDEEDPFRFMVSYTNNAENDFESSFSSDKSGYGALYYLIPRNLNEWKNDINLPEQKDQFKITNTRIDIHNPGDIPVGFKVYFEGGQVNQDLFLKLSSTKQEVKLKRGYYPSQYICFDFYNQSVYGCDAYFLPIKSANYNKYLLKDEFYLLSRGSNALYFGVQPSNIDMYYLFF